MLVPACPDTREGFKDALARSFYKGCAAQELSGIPYSMKSDTMDQMLVSMTGFANERSKKLLVIIDQMKPSHEYFTAGICIRWV